MKNLATIEEKFPEVQLLVKGGREKGYLLYEEIHTILSDEATAVPSQMPSAPPLGRMPRSGRTPRPAGSAGFRSISRFT